MVLPTVIIDQMCFQQHCYRCGRIVFVKVGVRGNESGDDVWIVGPRRVAEGECCEVTSWVVL